MYLRALLQALSSRGYVVVDYQLIEKDLVGALDLDGDGHITSADVLLAQDRVLEQVVRCSCCTRCAIAC
jgi:hypothetical protein